MDTALGIYGGMVCVTAAFGYLGMRPNTEWLTITALAVLWPLVIVAAIYVGIRDRKV